MPKVYQEAPYYDDYDASKDYTKLLALPGRTEQAREFTQIQTILYDYLGRLGDTILKEGSIVEGCTLTIKNNVATISDGKVYLSGLVRRVEGTSINITGVGNEVIGVVLEETVVTEVQDPSFNDPASGYENYGQAGAHRVKEVVKFKLNDNQATTVYRLSDGQLVLLEEKPQLDVITDLLARRTFDESGNYKVSGLVIMGRDESDANNVYVNVTEGKAYVLGYEVIKPATSKVTLKKATNTRAVLNEPKSYSSGTLKYKLNNHPVKEISRVKSVLETTQTITRGNIAGGIDYLPKFPVVDIVEVNQGETTYVKGKDFQLTNDGIDWSLMGKDPSPGTQYVCKWRYQENLDQGTGYVLERGETASYVVLKNASGIVPNTTLDIDYEFFLARKDVICIDKLGNLSVIEGDYDILRLVQSPLNSSADLLALGSVLLYPDSAKVAIVTYDTTRLAMNDLFNVRKRVDDIEYNIAATDLDEEAIAGESPTNLKGVFTDGFLGFSKSDTYHKQYNCAIDLDMQEMTLPSTSVSSALNPNNNTVMTSVGKMGRIIMAPYKNVVAIEQPSATDTMLVNPYAVYDRMSLVTLNPAVDNWIDESNIVVEKNKVSTMELRRWWKHKGSSWADEEKKKWEDLGFQDGGESLNWDTPDAQKKVSVSTNVILDEAVTYMRQRDVVVRGHAFYPNADNVKCEFDGTKVNLTPLEGTSAGTAPGTIRVNSKGEFSAKFTIPPNIPCGNKEVKLISSQGAGSAIYSATGRVRHTETTVLTEEIVIKPVDPLAQSFSFDEDKILSGVGLYFSAKDESSPVNIQIRDMVNGYPGTKCYAQVIVRPDQISVSPTGTQETVVNFENPVYCKANVQYCVCILSDSNVYEMHIATLGNKDKITGEFVTRQPYSVGVLFSSSNALTWTAHQNQDLKFKIYTAEYTGKGVIVFDDVNNVMIDRLLVAADEMKFKDNGIEWFYSVNDGPWLPIYSFDARETSQLAKKVKLKVELTPSQSTSPLLAADTLNFIGFLNKTTATYVSKNVVFDENYKNIRVILDLALPSGSTAKVYYATDANGDTWTELTSPNVVPVDSEFNKYEYTKTLDGAGTKNYRVKVILETSNPLIRPRARKLMNILKY